MSTTITTDAAATATTTGSEAAGHAATAAEHAAGGHASFPPFDPSTFEPQLIWLAISFVALYVILSRVALPRIGAVIAERQGRIAADLAEAERLKSETEKALKAYEQALAEAKGKAVGIAQKTRESLKAETEAERAKVEHDLAARLAAAEASIGAAKVKALAEVNGIAGDTAAAIVDELVGLKIGREEALAAVSKALAR
jgi:F-type H+-transporting ATPase subunit b